MASGLGMVGPINPLGWLQLQTQLKQQQNAQPDSGGPPPAAPVAAPPPAPATAPPGGSSPVGGGGGIGGIGTAISRAMSGAGLFGTSEGTGEIDPMTGLGANEVTRANNQSLMKVGLLLMAAGVRQSDDSRARMLAAAAGAADNSESLNSFAKNRLAMAEYRLKEKKHLNDLAASDALIKSVTGGDVPAATTPPPGPGATTPIGTPLPGAPVAAPPMAVEPAGGTGTGPTPPTPVSGAPTSPGVSPDGLPVGISTAPPPPPAPMEWRAGPQDAAHMRLLASEPAKLSAYIQEQRNKMRDTQVESAPYYDPAQGVVVDVYKGGRKIGTEKKRDLDASVRSTPGPDGTLLIERVEPGTNRVIERKVERDPIYDEAGRVIIKRVDEDFEKVKGTYDTEIQPAVDTIKKVTELQNSVRRGETITGTAAELRKQATRVLGSLGFGSEDKIQHLKNTTEIFAKLGAEAGRFAKENYGPQVSEWDVRNAQQLLGAIESGLPEEIDAALNRIRETQLKKIETYGARAAEFEDRVGRAKKVDKEFYKLPRPTTDFGAPIDWTPEGKSIRPKGTTATAGVPTLAEIQKDYPHYTGDPRNWPYVKNKDVFK